MKYSIIIPCYNEEENIENLINLLLSYKISYDIEWVLVENGSNDNTRVLLEKKCKNIRNLKLVYINKNKGYGYGIIKGIENSSGDYIGWLHADMQVSPEFMFQFIQLNETKKEYKILYKGNRKNRNFIDNFFTFSMSIFATLLFQSYLYDIGAIPVLFDKSLIKNSKNFPNDFSIETYIYYIAKKRKYKIIRSPVYMKRREKGCSSWNRGFISKIKQSFKIIKGLIKIRFKDF